MKIIAMLNDKGGVGKTASSANIAVMIAHTGKRVLLIDVDPQGNLSMILSDMDTMDIFASIIQGEETASGYTVEDLFINSEIDIHETIKKTRYENLDIIPSLLTLSEIEEILKADVRTPQQFRLKKHLKDIQKEYDYCIIDCSPSVNILNINALAAAQEVYIPCRPDAHSAIGLVIVKRLIDTVQDYNPELEIAGYFYTPWNARKNISRQVHALLNAYMPDRFIPVSIPQNKLVEEMSITQRTLLDADKNMRYATTKGFWLLAQYITMSKSERKKFRKDNVSEFDKLIADID